jgi:hypothetical protein
LFFFFLLLLLVTPWYSVFFRQLAVDSVVQVSQLVWIPMIHYHHHHNHKDNSFDPILSQFNPVHIFTKFASHQQHY